MARIKTFSEIVNNMIERLRISQPNLDTKIGSVSRDVFIDIQADEMQKIYNLISIISEKQSFATATGKDLDLIARNFGISRNSGALSSGIIVFSTSNLNNDLSIPEGTEVSTRSGVTFRTIGSYILSPTQRNVYASNASRLRSSLNKAGISDEYAIEVPIQAVSRGTAGNISAFQINQNAGPLDLNVINTQPTSGGSNAESDSVFRARIFSLFNGSNTGTSIGFRNAALGTDGVVDALVVEPGSSLMLRDGSEVIQSDDGNLSVVNSGTGGKVDIYILGSNITQITESFSFRDKSSDENISDDKNDLILGYSNQDLLKTNLQRRKDAYSSGNFPLQPVNSVINIQGSLSGLLTEGVNFILEKDLNPDTGGSPFGQDKIKFISDKKIVTGESITKSKNSSGDNISFFNAKSFDSVYQDVFLENEIAEVDDLDRSLIMLRNPNIVSITSIRNINTGEQYSNTSFNFEDGINESGNIKILGNKLPTKGEVVSVSYTSRFYFDENINFQSDSNVYFSNDKISDKIYWGPSDYIEKEENNVNRNSDGTNYIVSTSQKIEDIISVYSYTSELKQVQSNDLGKYVDLSNNIKNIISIKDFEGVELYKFNKDSYISKNMRLYIPREVSISEFENITVEYNRVDYYNLESGTGSFYENTIVFPSDSALEDEGLLGNVSSISNSFSEVYVDYLVKKGSMVSSEDISSMPIVGSSNSNSLNLSNGSSVEGSFNPVEYIFESGVPSKVNIFSPSYISISINSSFPDGIMRFSGETLTKVRASVPGNFFDGLTMDLSSAIKQVLGRQTIPSSVRVAKVSKLSLEEKEFDLLGYSISNNIFDKSYSKQDSSLETYAFEIPENSNNSSINFSAGSLFDVEFYIENKNDFEDVRFIANGRKITNKIFTRISSIDPISGFRDQTGSLSGLVSVSKFDKPLEGESYSCDYSFKAPVDGERLTVNYTINRLIVDATQSIESVRPITSDVLVKEAEQLSVDCTVNIVVSDELSESTDIVIENVQNQVTNILSSTQLGGAISASEIISSASSIQGVDAASVVILCESGDSTRLSFIKALDNQSIFPGTIQVNKISRRNFE